MKKSQLRIALFVFFCFVIAISVFTLVDKVNKNNHILYSRNTLPFIFLRTIDDELIYTDKKFTILFLFDPSCNHCLNSISEICENHEYFIENFIFMVSNTNKKSLIDLSKSFDIKRSSPIKIIADVDGKLFDYFRPKVMPMYLIYNRRKELIKSFSGETKIETILNFIK